MMTHLMGYPLMRLVSLVTLVVVHFRDVTPVVAAALVAVVRLVVVVAVICMVVADRLPLVVVLVVEVAVVHIISSPMLKPNFHTHTYGPSYHGIHIHTHTYGPSYHGIYAHTHTYSGNHTHIGSTPTYGSSWISQMQEFAITGLAISVMLVVGLLNTGQSESVIYYACLGKVVLAAILCAIMMTHVLIKFLKGYLRVRTDYGVF